MNKKERKRYSPEQKAVILREHYVNKRSVSEVCDKHELQPSMFYLWQKQLWAQAPAALQDGRKQRSQRREDRERVEQVQRLEERLAKREHVIAELSQECVTLKKRVGLS